MSNTSVDTSIFETVLGTPTAQKILKILVVYFSLSVQDLSIKSNVSKSQVHNTLRNLTANNILHSPSRGTYTFSDTSFAKSLKETYHIKILEVINAEIYNIKQLLKENHIDAANSKFAELVEQFKPILEESFVHQLNSLSHSFLDRMKDYRK